MFDTSEQKQKKQNEEGGNETKAAKPKLIIASKLALSDGVCQIKAMIPEQSFKKLVSNQICKIRIGILLRFAASKMESLPIDIQKLLTDPYF